MSAIAMVKLVWAWMLFIWVVITASNEVVMYIKTGKNTLRRGDVGALLRWVAMGGALAVWWRIIL